MAKDKQTREKQAKILRDALQKKTQEEGVSKAWFDKHVIVEVSGGFTFDEEETECGCIRGVQVCDYHMTKVEL